MQALERLACFRGWSLLILNPFLLIKTEDATDETGHRDRCGE